MRVAGRHTVMILFMWLMFAGVCLGKQVHLKDGSILDSQSAWRKGDKVFVKVNRDIVAEFNSNEIDLRRTFPKTGSPSRRGHRKDKPGAGNCVPPAATAPKPAVKPRPGAAIPAPRPDTPPAPVSKVLPQPAALTASTEPAANPDKAEMQRRAQDAAKMMVNAVMNKDPELMKKMLEAQKSAMPQQGAAAQQKTGSPLSLILIILAVALLIVIGQWIIFERAGRAGWKCLVPFYNMYVLMEISGKPGWWMFLLFVPLVGVVIYLFAMLSLAKKFRRSELFGAGLLFLPMVFFPVLAFGGSEYEG